MNAWKTLLQNRLDTLLRQLDHFFVVTENAIPSSLDGKCLRERLHAIFQKVSSGVQVVIDTSGVLAHTPEEHTAFLQAVSDLITVSHVILEQVADVIHALMKGSSLQTILGIEEKTLESLYYVASHLYEQQQYEEASGVFCLLCLLNPSYAAFWLGSGHCEYCSGKYQEALQAYTCAAQVEPDSVEIQVLLAKCYLGLGNYSVAQSIVSIIENSTDAKTLYQFRHTLDTLRIDIIRKAL